MKKFIGTKEAQLIKIHQYYRKFSFNIISLLFSTIDLAIYMVGISFCQNEFSVTKISTYH